MLVNRCANQHRAVRKVWEAVFYLCKIHDLRFRSLLAEPCPRSFAIFYILTIPGAKQIPLTRAARRAVCFTGAHLLTLEFLKQTWGKKNLASGGRSWLSRPAGPKGRSTSKDGAKSGQYRWEFQLSLTDCRSGRLPCAGRHAMRQSDRLTALQREQPGEPVAGNPLGGFKRGVGTRGWCSLKTRL